MTIITQDGNYLKAVLKHDDNNDERFSEASFAALNDQKVWLLACQTQAEATSA